MSFIQFNWSEYF